MITWKDKVVWGLVLLFCFLAFQHEDLIAIITSAKSLMNGHLLDFYDFNNGCNYLLSTYVLFAIWGAPLKLLGLDPVACHLWFKVLTTLFWAGSGFLIFKVSKQIGFKEEKPKQILYLWITSPLAIFSQFIFAQSDILTLFFTLLGLHFFFSKRLSLFAFTMGLAATFKYFPVFLFFPLLLLAEKRITRLAYYVLLFALVPACIVIPFFSTQGFQEGVLGFGAANRIYSTYLSGTRILFFNFVWMMLCCYCYLKDRMIRPYEAIWYCYFALAMVFSIMVWHPQWIILIVPFLIWAYFPLQKWSRFLILDVAMMGSFVAFSVINWVSNVDQVMAYNGVWAPFMQFKRPMRDVFPLIQHHDIYLTVFTVLLLLPLFYKLFFRNEKENFDLPLQAEIPGCSFAGLLRWRFVLGMAMFGIPFVLTMV